ncbi:MAG TPA: SCP2 sterol-binding domain-containing protein [Actinomycetota bacterium]|jgi:putative sterol carrier protein
MTDQGFSPDQVTAEEFASLVANATDDQIQEVIRGVGTKETLQRIFGNFPERFQPDKAQGVDAEIQFVVTDQGEEFAHLVIVRDGTCTTEEKRAEDPRVTLTTDLVSFVKLITGQAQGVQLFMTGKLKVSGDLMFSQRIMTFFEPAKA